MKKRLTIFWLCVAINAQAQEYLENSAQNKRYYNTMAKRGGLLKLHQYKNAVRNLFITILWSVLIQACKPPLPLNNKKFMTVLSNDEITTSNGKFHKANYSILYFMPDNKLKFYKKIIYYGDTKSARPVPPEQMDSTAIYTYTLQNDTIFIDGFPENISYVFNLWGNILLTERISETDQCNMYKPIN